MTLIDLNSPPLSDSVLTVGTFDGLHQGHKTLIDTLLTEAKKTYLPSVVATFATSPKRILSPKTYTGELRSFPEKLHILTRLGVDYCLELPVTANFFRTPPQEFYTLLHTLLNPQKVIVGSTHTFGKDATGNPQTLQEIGAILGFEVIPISIVTTSEEPTSTSVIKSHIDQGNLAYAHKLLGASTWLTGTVIRGKQLARTLGYPTANILPNFPVYHYPYGVYATKVHLHDRVYRGSLSIGTNPTTDTDTNVKYEVYIHDFDEDIYTEPIAVELLHYLRPEQTFDSLDALQQAMAHDIITTESLLAL